MQNLYNVDGLSSLALPIPGRQLDGCLPNYDVIQREMMPDVISVWTMGNADMVGACERTSVCLHACVCICMCMCMYVYVYACVCMHVCVSYVSMNIHMSVTCVVDYLCRQSTYIKRPHLLSLRMMLLVTDSNDPCMRRKMGFENPGLWLRSLLKK